MKNKFLTKIKSTFSSTYFWLVLILLFLIFILVLLFPNFLANREIYLSRSSEASKSEKKLIISVIPPLNKVAYDKKMNELANNPPDPIIYKTIKIIKKSKNGKSITKTTKVPVSPQPIISHFWPVKTVYPNTGAILPFHRIVAFYGNLYSKNMGILGQYKEDVMIEKLKAEVKKWNIADPKTPVIPALHYIVVVAQGTAGRDGKYRTRMPDSEIEKVIKIAKKIKALVFLDIQVGLSNLQTEVPLLKKYLKMPQVHLGIDPEFSMKNGVRPGKIVGTVDASDINFTVNYLAQIVRENKLTPKILVIHRYTQKMLTNYKKIKPLKEVQIVIDMDGWGDKAHKISTYKQFIYEEPIQFTGFKLFYKNDVRTEGSTLMTPNNLLKLVPQPIYIQYQ